VIHQRLRLERVARAHVENILVERPLNALAAGRRAEKREFAASMIARRLAGVAAVYPNNRKTLSSPMSLLVFASPTFVWPASSSVRQLDFPAVYAALAI